MFRPFQQDNRQSKQQPIKINRLKRITWRNEKFWTMDNIDVLELNLHRQENDSGWHCTC